MNARMTLAIIVAVLSAMSGAAASGQLDPLMSVSAVKAVGAVSGLITTALASVSAILATASSQAASVAQNPGVLAQALQQTPGISAITVNAQATPELAAMAVDANQAKIGPEAGQERGVVNQANKA